MQPDPNQPDFEEAWRRAFADAEATPSPRVWQGVEAHLDRRHRRPLAYWRWAAAALLLMTAGLLTWQRVTTRTAPASTVAQRPLPPRHHLTDAVPRPNAARPAPLPVPGSVNEAGSLPQPASHAPGRFPTVPAPRPASEPVTNPLAKGNSPDNQLEKARSLSYQLDTMQALAPLTTDRADRLLPPRPTAPLPDRTSLAGRRSLTTRRGNRTLTATTLPLTHPPASPGQPVVAANEQGNAPPLTETAANLLARFTGDALTGRSARPLPPPDLAARRPVAGLLPDANPATTVRVPRPRRPVWLAASFTPGAYNPRVEANYQPVLAAQSVNISHSASYRAQDASPASPDRNLPGASGQWSLLVGKDVGRRWQLSVGVHYLRASATLQTQAVVRNADGTYAPRLAELLNPVTTNANVVRQLMDSFRAAPSLSYGSRTSVPAELSVQNQYQYVGIPVRVGYQLASRGPWRVMALVGVNTDFFLRNTLAETVVNNPLGVSAGLVANKTTTSRTTVSEITGQQPSAFRPVGLSGILGVGVYYRVGSRWAVAFEPTGQVALHSVTRPASHVRTLPVNLGAGLGLRYQF